MSKFDEWYHKRLNEYTTNPNDILNHNDDIDVDILVKEAWNAALEEAINVYQEELSPIDCGTYYEGLEALQKLEAPTNE